MKLLKVNLIFIPLLALCLGAVGYAARKMLLEDARQHVLQNARLLMETALSSRKYTIKYITPLILQYDYNAQTGLSEFRKSIEEIPTAPSPEAAHNLPGSLKKGYLLGQQRALDEEKRFLESLERRAEEFRPYWVSPPIGIVLRGARDPGRSTRKISRILLQGSRAQPDQPTRSRQRLGALRDR